jgi:hypothetical protein
MSLPDLSISPNWAAWGAWHTSPYGFVELCAKIASALGPGASIDMKAMLRSGPRQYQFGEQPTKKELATFRWLQIVGSTSAIRMEVDIVRNKPAEPPISRPGVSLKTFPLLVDSTEVAIAAHNAVAAQIDDNAVSIGGFAHGGGDNNRSQRHLLWLNMRRQVLLVLLAFALPLPVYIIPWIPEELVSMLPDPAYEVVYLCTCSPNNKLYWITACIAATIVSLILVRRLFPSISITDTSGWRRLGITIPTIAGLLIKTFLVH